MVMTGLAVMSGIDTLVAMMLGSDATARIGLQTACSFALAALGGTVFVLWKIRKAPS